MRLQHRLLILFALCAVLPFLAIGGLGYARSLRSLEALVGDETRAQAARIARGLKDRLEHLESDVALLSDNEETQRLLRAQSDDQIEPAVVSAAARYVDELWNTMRFAYDRIVILDRSGRVLIARQDSLWRENQGRRGGLPPIIRQITEAQTRVGELQLYPRATELFPIRDMQGGFGEKRLNLVIDRTTGARILASGGQSRSDIQLPSSLMALLRSPALADIRYDDAGDRRIAAVVNFETPPWTVLATASVGEFAAPFLRQRVVDLSLLVMVVLALSLGFYLLLRRATRPLDQLAAAAARVGEGNLSPELPPMSDDEVGRLTRAFGDMAARLREMLAQIEASRQTAVLGRFAVELAHEIRNPLTSVKLNLQGLERDARAGRLPEESGLAVDVSLREVRRIDQALRTALRVGRPMNTRRHYDVRTVLFEAVALLQPEAEANKIHILCHWNGARADAQGDPEAMRGVFVNLLVNAIQAMAGVKETERGEAISIEAHETLLRDGAHALEIRFRDDGPGIPAELRDRVFHPFFTTKAQGTGLGLSVALQSVQAMGGSLRFGETSRAGAEFVVTLPLGGEAAIE